MKKKYDAFISYRHCDPDKYVAELLHKQMEAFRLPGRMADKCRERTRIERVFRDRDELPLANNLEDPIKQALSDSEYLIVICSPRLKESLWCQKEIDTFIEMNGKEKVFAVLVEGEPSDSFPEQLLYREEEVTTPDGKREVVRKAVEPLAADVRGADKRKIKKAMKTELLRLLAPMFGLSFDDLKQRHRERKMKRLLAIAFGVAAVCLSFGTVSTAMALRIHSQKQKIEQQNSEISRQNEEILAQTAEIKIKNDELSLNQALALARESGEQMAQGDRMGALESAIASLTSYQGIEMPYTPQGQYALSEALYAYSVGDMYQPVFQMKTRGVLYGFLISEDRTKLLCSDDSQILYLFDLENGSLIKEFYDARGEEADQGNFCFLDGERIAYITNEGNVCVYDMVNDTTTEPDGMQQTAFLYYDQQASRLWTTSFWDGVKAFDGKNFQQTAYIPKQEKELYKKVVAVSNEDSLMAYSSSVEGEAVLHLVSPEGEEKCNLNFGEDSIKAVRIGKEGIFVLVNHFRMLQNEYGFRLICYDKDNFREKWSYENNGSTGYLMRFSGYESSELMMVCTSGEAIVLNRNRGEELQRFVLGTEPAEGFAYTTSDLFAIIGRDGNFYSINMNQKTCYQMPTIFTSCFSNLREAAIGKDCIVDLAYNSNVITCYQRITGKGIREYDGELSDIENKRLEYNEAAAFAEERKLDHAALVKEVFWNADETLAFVCYRNGDVSVYDMQEGKVRNTVNVGRDSLITYFGKDSAGNHYIGGNGDGYILNPDMELIGRVDKMVELRADENQVVVAGRGNVLYTIPIQDKEELLAYASEVVLR